MSRVYMLNVFHEARHQPPVSLPRTRSLIETQPQSVEIRDDHQWLPLHHVCRNGAFSLEVVQTLVTAWPASVREWTNDGFSEARLPIHLACQYGAPLSVVAYLATQDPTCLQAVSPKQMYTALDFALYYFHQRRREGLDVSEAEQVVHYLAHARIENKHDRDEQDKKRHAAFQAVQARPLIRAVPHPVCRMAPENARNTSLKPSVLCRRASAASKIIRIKLPRPAVPLR